MAILDIRQVRQVLQSETTPATLETQGGTGTNLKAKNLQKLLNDSNLSAPEVLENLSTLMRSGDSDSVRLRAAELGCKINGLLSADEAGKDFNVTIIIKDSVFGEGVNPILIPRQI